MDTLNVCPNCSQPFRIRSAPQSKSNIPLFLPCGHSMCETCIRNILKFVEPIECKICHGDTTVKPSDLALLSLNRQNLYNIFPVNFTMLGELIFQQMEKADNKSMEKKERHYIDLQAILKNADSTQGSCLECHTLTTKMCRQCATILCDSCFNKSHKNFVIFKNHVLQDIEPMTEPNTCKTHKDKPLDYYCKDCFKPVCMDCLVVGGEKSCKNHNVVSIQEVNDSFIEELNDIAPKVNEIFRRLTKTAVDIGHLLYNMENETGTTSDLTQMLTTIEQHFSKIFNAVQKHKQEVTDIIVKLKHSEKESLNKAKITVTDSIKKAKCVLNSINKSLNPKKKKESNLAAIFDDAKRVIEFPWHLTRDESNDPLKVAVNEDLCTLISDYIHLEGNADSVYKLRSTSELGEDANIPPAPAAPVFPPELPKDVREKNPPAPVVTNDKWVPQPFFKEVPKYRSKSGSVSSLNSADSEKSYRSSATAYTGENFQRPMIQEVQPFAESKHPQQLHEGSQELIYISHIVDPQNFFVQRAYHQNMVKAMLKEFRNAISMPKPSVNHVTEGKLYLMFNRADNMWQRCRIVSINRKVTNAPEYQVFCIDFGSTEKVQIDKLRLLPPARLQSPYPLAINCSLANIKPKTGAWSSDDAYLIQKIVDNKQAILHVRHIRSTSNYNVTLECDVTTYDRGISLAHALAFHDRANLLNPKLVYPKIDGEMEKPKLFMNNNDFKHKAVEEVFIKHIVSPDKFYIRKRHLQNVYEKLCEELEQEYNMSNNCGSVHLPEVDMVCVVNVEKEPSLSEEVPGGWARGVVKEIPGHGRVTLLLPDIGLLVLVHWTSLRYIHHKFTVLRALATECYLAGVTPLNKKWSPGSVALMEKFSARPLELHVEDARRGALGVSLYDNSDPDNIVCINTEMLKHKFAVTFGLFMFNKNTVEEQVVTNKNPLKQPKPRPAKIHEVEILKKEEKNSCLSTSVDENELEAKDKGPLRLGVKILHYQSPSLFYVSLIHQQNAFFNDFYEKIQEYYTKNKTQGKKEWAVDDRCCTLCAQSQTWRRAAIMELQGDNAKVFYTDFACIEVVPISSLRELTREFAQIGDAAIKCNLFGVVSADGEEWPTITKEYLKEIIDAYQTVFITKCGNFNDSKGSMPVELWAYHIIQGGALEANKAEWRCFNKKIIEQGLAIPDKQQKALDTTEETEDNMLTFLRNVTGSVSDWLQLEPVPMKPMDTSSLKSKTESQNSNMSSPLHGEDENLASEGGSTNTVFITDWLPSEPLQAKEFIGMPTYIDNDGVIYLHDVTQQDTMDIIRKALDVRFSAPDPKAKYTKWNVGEPCIALYYLDNRFYRGRIMEVDNETSVCIVQYVDYGNEESCSFENLRKSIVLYQIPVQAHKCALNRIRPVDGRWDRQALDYLHKSIVEKKCHVKVCGESIGGVLPIELKYDKLWINDHLVEFDMAVYTDGSKAVVRKYVATTKSAKVASVVIESDSGPDYLVDHDNDTSIESCFKSLEGQDWNKLIEEDEKQNIPGNYFQYPKNEIEEFKCNISIINDLKVFQLNIIQDEDVNVLYEQMYKEIQREGADMLPLNGIFENKACIALYHEDEQWYRASIMQYSENDYRVKVRYVDYGNIEVVSLADVREISTDWMELPPATIAAVLDGVKVNFEMDNDVISEEYAKVLLDKEPFHAKVVKYEGSMPCVVLHDENGELVYEKLFEKQIFLRSKDE